MAKRDRGDRPLLAVVMAAILMRMVVWRRFRRGCSRVGSRLVVGSRGRGTAA